MVSTRRVVRSITGWGSTSPGRVRCCKPLECLCFLQVVQLLGQLGFDVGQDAPQDHGVRHAGVLQLHRHGFARGPCGRMHLRQFRRFAAPLAMHHLGQHQRHDALVHRPDHGHIHLAQPVVDVHHGAERHHGLALHLVLEQ